MSSGHHMNHYETQTQPSSLWSRSDGMSAPSARMEPSAPPDPTGPVAPPDPTGPVAPDVPTKPSTPAPSVPAVPTQPSTPLPVIPAVPTQPSTPAPVIPSVPMQPATPAPVIPSVPMQPATPLPVIPAIPTQPAIPAPVIPAVPTFPSIPGVTTPIRPTYAKVRFLNAAYGYRSFRIVVNNRRVVNWLGYTELSGYSQLRTGYQTISVIAQDGYVYIQKTLPFQAGQPCTISIINAPNGGLDLLQIPDNCCPPNGNFSNLRVSNLVLNSPPLDMLLGDGRVVYSDIHFKETTTYKRIRAGGYQFFFAETNLAPMPRWMDIETLDSAFTGSYPTPDTVASLYLNVVPNCNYTIFLLSSGKGDAVQAILAENK